MDIRQPLHSEHARTLDTEGLRRHFLVEGVVDGFYKVEFGHTQSIIAPQRDLHRAQKPGVRVSLMILAAS